MSQSQGFINANYSATAMPQARASISAAVRSRPTRAGEFPGSRMQSPGEGRDCCCALSVTCPGLRAKLEAQSVSRGSPGFVDIFLYTKPSTQTVYVCVSQAWRRPLFRRQRTVCVVVCITVPRCHPAPSVHLLLCARSSSSPRTQCVLSAPGF